MYSIERRDFDGTSKFDAFIGFPQKQVKYATLLRTCATQQQMPRKERGSGLS